jgi:hypothetical protein
MNVYARDKLVVTNQFDRLIECYRILQTVRRPELGGDPRHRELLDTALPDEWVNSEPNHRFVRVELGVTPQHLFDSGELLKVVTVDANTHSQAEFQFCHCLDWRVEDDVRTLGSALERVIHLSN